MGVGRERVPECGDWIPVFRPGLAGTQSECHLAKTCQEILECAATGAALG